MTVLEAGSAVDKFDAPLRTQAEASRFLGLSQSTFRNWSRGYHSVIEGREVAGRSGYHRRRKVGSSEVRRSRLLGLRRAMHWQLSA